MLRHFRGFKCGDRSALGMKKAIHNITYWEKLRNDHYIHLLPYYFLHWKSAIGFSNAIHAAFSLSFEPYLSHDMEEVTVETFLHRCQSQIPYLFWGNPALQLKNSTKAAMLQIMGALSPLLEFSYKERILTLPSHKNMAHKVLLLERLSYLKPTQLLLFCSRNASPRHQILPTMH